MPGQVDNSRGSVNGDGSTDASRGRLAVQVLGGGVVNRRWGLTFGELRMCDRGVRLTGMDGFGEMRTETARIT